jgi:hypothetical protein
LQPDAIYPGMWRVRWPDGRLSDMVNLSRAKDAIAAFIESTERRLRGRQSQLEAAGSDSDSGEAVSSEVFADDLS